MPPNVNVLITAKDVNFSATMQKMRAEMTTSVGTTLALQTAIGSLKAATIVGGASLAAMTVPTLLISRALAGFDASLRRAIAVGGPTYANQLNNLSKEITKTAVQWGISSDEIAAGVVELAKAGFNYNTVTQEMMTGVAQLAKIHQESFNTISNIVTYAYTLYGNETMTALDLMEKMNQAANISVLNISDLGSAFEYAGSSALTSGMSIDEFLATIASLSNVATKSYQNIGTLLNRMLVSGVELERTLGVTTGTFVENGVLNINKFMLYLSKVPNKYDVIVKASDLWGVRSTRVVQAMMSVTDQYFEMLGEISNSQGTLGDQSKQMRESIESTWTRFVETLMTPVKQGTVLDQIQQALNALTTALSESELPNILQKFITGSAEFLKAYGPQLIDSISNLGNALLTFLPSIQSFATTMSGIIEILSKIPAPIMAMIGTFIMIKRFLPYDSFIQFHLATVMLRDNMKLLNFEFMSVPVYIKNVEIGFNSARMSAQSLGIEVKTLRDALISASKVTVFETVKSPLTKPIGTAYTAPLKNPAIYSTIKDISYLATDVKDLDLIFQRLTGQIVTQNVALKLQTGEVTNLAFAYKMAADGTGQLVSINGASVPLWTKIQAAYRGVSAETITMSNTMNVASNAMINAQIRAQILMSTGLMMLVQGFMLIVSSKNGVVRALGAISVALGVVAMIAMSAGSAVNLTTIGFAAVAALASMGIMMVAQRAMMKDIENEQNRIQNKIPRYQTGGFVRKTGLAIVHKDEYIIPKYYAEGDKLPKKFPSNTVYNNYDYKTVNIYDPSRLDLQRAMRQAGKL